MKAKILILSLIGISFSHAKMYTGLKLIYGIQKNAHEFVNVNDTAEKMTKTRKFTIHDLAPGAAAPDITTPGLVIIPNNQRRFKSKSMNFGILFGYTFDNLHTCYKPYVEVDLDFKSQRNVIKNIDMIPDEPGHQSTNALNNENFQIKSGPVLGLTLGVEAPITDALSALIGARFNVSRYTATAEHIQNAASELPANKQQRSAYLFAIEPTFALKYAINQDFAIRGAMGYNIGQTKGIVKNYVTNFGTMDRRTSAGLTLKPRSLNFSVAVIYTIN